MRLANKTALITGGNSGIGLASARILLPKVRRSPSPGGTRRPWMLRPQSLAPMSSPSGRMGRM